MTVRLAPIPEHVPLPKGFRAAGIHCGLKKNQQLDLGLLLADRAVDAAAIYTQNQLVGAHIHVCRDHLQKSGGKVRAVLVNARNANCATGERGIADARHCCEQLARRLGCPTEQVLMASTGPIGAPLPTDRIVSHLDPLLEVCEHLGCLPIVFETVHNNGAPIYHTNVVMSIGSTLAIVAEDCIIDERNKTSVRKLVQYSGKEILPITIRQMQSFCGNVLFATNTLNQECAIVSDTAWNAFSNEQKELLTKHATPLIVSIPVIERVGGGGVRCMIAELF